MTLTNHPNEKIHCVVSLLLALFLLLSLLGVQQANAGADGLSLGELQSQLSSLMDSRAKIFERIKQREADLRDANRDIQDIENEMTRLQEEAENRGVSWKTGGYNQLTVRLQNLRDRRDELVKILGHEYPYLYELNKNIRNVLDAINALSGGFIDPGTQTTPVAGAGPKIDPPVTTPPSPPSTPPDTGTAPPALSTPEKPQPPPTSSGQTSPGVPPAGVSAPTDKNAPPTPAPTTQTPTGQQPSVPAVTTPPTLPETSTGKAEGTKKNKPDTPQQTGLGKETKGGSKSKPSPPKETPTSKASTSTAGQPPENAGQTIEKGWVENKSGRTTLSHTYDSQGNLITVTETDTDPSGKVTGVRTYPGQGGPATVSGGSGTPAGGGGYNPLNDPALQGKGQGGGSGQVSTKAGDFQKGQWSAQDQQGKTASQAGSPYVTGQSPGYTTPYGATPPTTPTSGSTQQGATTDPNTQGTSTGGLSDVVVSSQTITVSVWDHGTVDGDIVNITLNGATAAGGVTLAAGPKTFTLNLNPGRNTISIYAVNEGSVPPNTASIKISHVTSGQAEQTYSINQKTSANFAATVDTGTQRQR